MQYRCGGVTTEIQIVQFSWITAPNWLLNAVNLYYNSQYIKSYFAPAECAANC